MDKVENILIDYIVMIKSVSGYSKNTNTAPQEASRHREETSQREFERVSTSTVLFSFLDDSTFHAE